MPPSFEIALPNDASLSVNVESDKVKVGVTHAYIAPPSLVAELSVKVQLSMVDSLSFIMYIAPAILVAELFSNSESVMSKLESPNE